MAVAIGEVARSGASPPLKWAGGKRWLVPYLNLYWRANSHRRLVEPFVGGLAVVLGLGPKRALLNDANPHLISFYEWLKRGLDPSRTRVQFVNDRDVYVGNRARFNELIARGESYSEEAAVLFYYLNRTCFNGLCRFNSRGFFNVPFGRYKQIPYRRSSHDFAEYVTALENCTFRSGDFETLRLRPTDFVYADPPYDVEFTEYSAGGFNYADQERLAYWLAKHKGPVVASNQSTSRIKKLYRRLGFKVTELAAPRRISCDGNREDAKEMLAMLNL